MNGSIVNLVKGNTEIAAEMVQNAIGGELFKIEPIEKYSSDYNECIEEAKQDMRNGKRPELEQYLDNIDDVETIVLDYPVRVPLRNFAQMQK